jgi:hypothetical protein
MTSVSAHIDVQWCSARSQARLDQHKGLTHERMHIQCPTCQQKQEGPDRHTSLFLLLSACASPRIKRKGIPINTPYNFYYFSYMPSGAHKNKGVHRYVLQVQYLINQVFKRFCSSADIIFDGLARPLTPRACLLVFIRTRGSKRA